MDEKVLLTLGRKIASLREEAGYTQKLLARKIGISPSYLGKVECGRSTTGISLEIIFQIAEGLNIPIEELLKQEKSDKERTVRYIKKRELRDFQKQYTRRIAENKSSYCK